MDDNNENNSVMNNEPKFENFESQASSSVDQSINQSETQPPIQPIEQQPEPQSPIQPENQQPEAQLISQPEGQQVSSQPANQSVNQPEEQPVTQPMNQPIDQPITTASASVTSDNNNSKNNKKTIAITCGIIGAVIAAVVVVLVIFLLRSGNKTVSCTEHQSVMGMDMDISTEVRVGNGEILGGNNSANIDFKNMSGIYADSEKEIVDYSIEQSKYECKEHCTFNYDYVEKDHLRITLEYDEVGVDELVITNNIEGRSAQEIADEIQKQIEEARGATCSQH